MSQPWTYEQFQENMRFIQFQITCMLLILGMLSKFKPAQALCYWLIGRDINGVFIGYPDGEGEPVELPPPVDDEWEPMACYPSLCCEDKTPSVPSARPSSASSFQALDRR